MLGMAMVMAIFVAPAQVLIGDEHGLNNFTTPTARIAAMEGIWEDERGAALRLFAIPDQENQTNNVK